MENAPVVIGIGEILWDEFHLAGGGTRVRLGGAPANFVYYAAEQGLDAALISAVGKDVAGRAIGGLCYAMGLACMLVETPQPTGRVLIQVDDEGVPAYDILPGVAWDELELREEMLERARHARVICFGSLAQRSRTTRETIRAVLDAMPQGEEHWRIFDANLRCSFYSEALIRESMQVADILKVNEEEFATISRMEGLGDLPLTERARMLMERYALRVLILTCGAAGSHVFAEGAHRHSFLASPEVEVVDTVGAGDSFTAGFIAALLRGLSLEEAHAAAVEVAARTCSRPGAMPSMEELVITSLHTC